MRLLLRHHKTWIALLLITVGTARLVERAVAKGLHPLEWDLLFVSGFLTLAIAIKLTDSLPYSFQSALRRLSRRNVLKADEPRLKAVINQLESRVRLWAIVSSGISAMAMALAFVGAWGLGMGATQWVLMSTEVVVGLIFGAQLGRMVAYGQLAHALAKNEIAIKPVPGHPDGAAGLLPLGRHYAWQAMIIFLPALFFSVWSLLARQEAFAPYEVWAMPYFFLSSVAWLFFCLAFIRPLWSFHHKMKEHKLKLIAELDAACGRILNDQNNESLERRTVLRDDYKELTERFARLYYDVEHMPTLPIGAKLWGRFTLSNVALAASFYLNVREISGS